VARAVLFGRRVSRRPPSILVLARAGAAGEELFAELAGRRDLIVLRADTVAAAALALRDLPVALVVTCNETSGDVVDALLGAIERVRPGTPVLAVRDRKAPERPAWRARGVGVLRRPLSPGVISRSIDVVLRLKGASSPTGER
jgi:hypothetical protein